MTAAKVDLVLRAPPGRLAPEQRRARARMERSEARRAARMLRATRRYQHGPAAAAAALEQLAVERDEGVDVGAALGALLDRVIDAMRAAGKPTITPAFARELARRAKSKRQIPHAEVVRELAGLRRLERYCQREITKYTRLPPRRHESPLELAVFVLAIGWRQGADVNRPLERLLRRAWREAILADKQETR